MKKFLLTIGVLVNIGVVAFFWWAHSGPLMGSPWTGGNPAIALGRLAGLLLQGALVLQLLLIGRIPFIERAFGYDRLNQFHRWLGYSMVALLVAHPMLLTLGYGARSSVAAPTSFVDLVTGFEDVLSAVGATLLLYGVIALSIPWVRRKLRYESWHLIHLLTYAAMALSFGHQLESGGDFAQSMFVAYWYLVNAVGVGVFLMYRFLRPFTLWYRHRFMVSRVVRESPDAWSVYITGRDMAFFRFEPGQFANIHLLAKSLWPGHPFSFSQEYDGVSLRFTIKSLGDDTKLIADLKPGVSVIIDGPLGRFTPRVARTNKFLLIGGGIGVTPVRAMAGDLGKQGRDVVVMYGARSQAHTALLSEIATHIPRTHVFLSDETVPSSTYLHQGQITAQSILECAGDVKERDVYVCGPGPMMDAIIASLRSIGVPSQQIHSERFAY